VLGLLPGHELVSGPIDGVGNAISVVFNAIGWTAVPEALAFIGPRLLGALVPILAVFVIYSRGIGSWTAHDAIERKKIRRETFDPPGERSARSECVLLVGGLAAVILASLVLPIVVVVAALLTVAAVALITRSVTWF
jgi:hypothetical protein